MIEKETVFEIQYLKKQRISNRKIALKLDIDRETVKKYLQNPNQLRNKVKRRSKLGPYHDISRRIQNVREKKSGT